MKTKYLLSAFFSFCFIQTVSAELPINEQFDPTVKAELKNKILTENEIYQGADTSQKAYYFCITDTAMKMKYMYPETEQDELIKIINSSCEYSEDRFNLYSILLAASSMKKPMSEKQAAVFIENNYKQHGRTQINQKQRIKIYQDIGLMQP